MPEFGVVVAVVEDDKVLLTKREDFPVWCLPGGGIENGETLAEAAVREVQEETGVNVKLTRLVGLYSRPEWSQSGSHGILFAASHIDGQLRTQTAETVDAGFFHPADLPTEILWWHRQRIADVFDGEIGLVRTQCVQWPGPGKTRAEVLELVKAGSVLPQDIVTKLCSSGAGDLERLDVSGAELK
jgi:ADP-ribose pyrophosphatase YjhB (NUDIX family)